MAQEIQNANIFGRIGSGLGAGLAEQLPKEIERNRLSSGLNRFAEDSANLTPLQQLARISTIPGVTPQMIQSFGELGKQQSKGQALIQSQNRGNEIKKSPFPKDNKMGLNKPSGSEIPSITQEENLRKIQEGYVPPTQEQIIENAGRMFNENPALYGNDPNKAIEAAEKAELRKEKIYETANIQNEKLSGIQDNVVKRLKDQSNKLGVEIPSNVYSDIEDRAIQSTKPKSLGGEGLTEQQSIKKYGKELDSISRDYSKLNQLSGWGITLNKPSEITRTLKSIQNSFEERGDTYNLADSMIEKYDVSPKFAYALAEPVKRENNLNKEIKSLPVLKGMENIAAYNVNPKVSREKTLEISPKLAKSLGKKGSPLAVAYELEKKGYDPKSWLNYVRDHKKELDLSVRQADQLDIPQNLIGKWNDWWLSSFSGIQ